jgi:hypothetical protein
VKKLLEIIDKLKKEVNRWQNDRLVGRISLHLDFSQGGINNWSIETRQTAHRGKRGEKTG